jgi:flagellar hook-basal body complex protein FliE
MNEQSVSAITQITENKGLRSLKAVDQVQQMPDNFGNLIANGISQVNDKLIASQSDLQKVATGETGNLHQVMMRLEESKLSFQLMMQIRNKLLEAYQEVLKMQV